MTTQQKTDLYNFRKFDTPTKPAQFKTVGNDGADSWMVVALFADNAQPRVICDHITDSAVSDDCIKVCKTVIEYVEEGDATVENLKALWADFEERRMETGSTYNLHYFSSTKRPTEFKRAYCANSNTWTVIAKFGDDSEQVVCSHIHRESLAVECLELCDSIVQIVLLHDGDPAVMAHVWGKFASKHAAQRTDGHFLTTLMLDQARQHAATVLVSSLNTEATFKFGDALIARSRVLCFEHLRLKEGDIISALVTSRNSTAQPVRIRVRSYRQGESDLAERDMESFQRILNGQSLPAGYEIGDTADVTARERQDYENSDMFKGSNAAPTQEKDATKLARNIPLEDFAAVAQVGRAGKSDAPEVDELADRLEEKIEGGPSKRSRDAVDSDSDDEYYEEDEDADLDDKVKEIVEQTATLKLFSDNDKKVPVKVSGKIVPTV